MPMMLKVGEETWDYETHGNVILTAVEKKGKNKGDGEATSDLLVERLPNSPT